MTDTFWILGSSPRRNLRCLNSSVTYVSVLRQQYLSRCMGLGRTKSGGEETLQNPSFFFYCVRGCKNPIRRVLSFRGYRLRGVVRGY